MVHTKVRNRLAHQKLQKLVYVNYNLRIRLRDAGSYKEPDEDPFEKLMQLSLYEETNPIRDWMENGRSNAAPLLDEETTESDTPLPAHLVVDPTEASAPGSLVRWADKVVGETHLGKRKEKTLARKEPAKKLKGRVPSDESTASDNSHTSPPPEGDDGGDAAWQGGTSDAPVSPVRFTGTCNSICAVIS